MHSNVCTKKFIIRSMTLITSQNANVLTNTTFYFRRILMYLITYFATKEMSCKFNLTTQNRAQSERTTTITDNAFRGSNWRGDTIRLCNYEIYSTGRQLKRYSICTIHPQKKTERLETQLIWREGCTAFLSKNGSNVWRDKWIRWR